jgi:hypothetical protein
MEFERESIQRDESVKQRYTRTYQLSYQRRQALLCVQTEYSFNLGVTQNRADILMGLRKVASASSPFERGANKMKTGSDSRLSGER